MPIRVVVDRGRSKSSPVTAAAASATRPGRREAEEPMAEPSMQPRQSVQRLAPVFASPEKEAEAESVRTAARSGLRTPGTELPFAARIRQAFPSHDLTGVQAHLGPAATASAEEMQADAYAAGEHVVFRGRPDLRTVAHEVAHVVQQRAGARPERGIGRQGDAYERQADSVAQAVAAGRPAAGLPPALPPSPASQTSPAPVQRMVRKWEDSSGTKYYTTLEKPRKLYDSRAKAKAKEREILAGLTASAHASARATKFTGSTAAQQVAPKKGVSKSPDVDYPARPAELAVEAFPSIAPLHASYSRSGMGLPMRQLLISSAQAKSPAERTDEDQAMIASPAQNMVDANISMNHKLADSSVATLMQVMWAKIQKLGGASNLSSAQDAAILEFTQAMAEPAEAASAYGALMDATDMIDAKKAATYLAAGIDILSLSAKNLRFGKADLNTLILYAFDPNQDSSGTDTPLTDRIRSAVRGLAKAGLVPKSIVNAALTQAVRKATAEPLSSSSVV